MCKNHVFCNDSKTSSCRQTLQLITTVLQLLAVLPSRIIRINKHQGYSTILTFQPIPWRLCYFEAPYLQPQLAQKRPQLTSKWRRSLRSKFQTAVIFESFFPSTAILLQCSLLQYSAHRNIINNKVTKPSKQSFIGSNVPPKSKLDTSAPYRSK